MPKTEIESELKAKINLQKPVPVSKPVPKTQKETGTGLFSTGTEKERKIPSESPRRNPTVKLNQKTDGRDDNDTGLRSSGKT